mgnify:CR=1 FL=1
MLAAAIRGGRGNLIRSDLTLRAEPGWASGVLLAYQAWTTGQGGGGVLPEAARRWPGGLRSRDEARGRLRVGFVSSLLQNHTIGVLTRRLIAPARP